MTTKEKSIKYRFQLLRVKDEHYVVVTFAKEINIPPAEALHYWLIEKFTCNKEMDQVYDDIANLIHIIKKPYLNNNNHYIQGSRSVVHLNKKGVHVFDTYYECNLEFTRKYQMKLEMDSFLLLLQRLRTNIKLLEKQNVNEIDTVSVYTLEMKDFHP